MSTVAQNLQTLQQIKSDIKTAIIGKGQSVGDDMTAYATAISNISGGGEKVTVNSDAKFVGKWSQTDIDSAFDFSTYNGKVSTGGTGATGYSGQLGMGLFGALVPAESSFVVPAMSSLTSPAGSSVAALFRSTINYSAYTQDYLGKDVAVDCRDISTLVNYTDFFRGYPAKTIVMGNMPNATNMSYMFANCGKLTTLTIGNVNNSLSTVTSMFAGTSLTTLTAGTVPSTFPVVNTVTSLTAYWSYVSRYLSDKVPLTSLTMMDDVTSDFSVWKVNSSVKETLLDSLSTSSTGTITYTEGDLTSEQIASAEAKGWDVSLYEPIRRVTAFNITNSHRAVYLTGITNYDTGKISVVMTPQNSGGGIYIGRTADTGGARLFAATTNLYWDYGSNGRASGSISGRFGTKMLIECTVNNSYKMTLVAKLYDDQTTTIVNANGTGRSYGNSEQEFSIGNYVQMNAHSDYFTFYEASFYDRSNNLIAHFVPAIETDSNKPIIYETESGRVIYNSSTEDPEIIQ